MPNVKLLASADEITALFQRPPGRIVDLTEGAQATHEHPWTTAAEIALLLLPATEQAVPMLLGATRLLATGRILAVAFIAPAAATPAPLPRDVLGTLAKYAYDWAGDADGRVSLAVHERAAAWLLGTADCPLIELWLVVARRLAIRPRGVLHVGARDGQEVALYRQAGATRIVLIEANPRLSARLVAHFAGVPDVTCIDAALGDRAAAATLHLASNGQSSSLLAPRACLIAHPDVRFDRSIELETTTLDALARRHDFEDCNVLHMDIQGAELLALRGAERTLRHIDLIDVGVHYAENYAACAQIEDLDALLACRGFARTAVRTPYETCSGHAVYVRHAHLWAHDALGGAAGVLQQLDLPLRRVVCVSDGAWTAAHGAHSRARLADSFGLEMRPIATAPRLAHIVPPREPWLESNGRATFPVALEFRFVWDELPDTAADGHADTAAAPDAPAAAEADADAAAAALADCDLGVIRYAARARCAAWMAHAARTPGVGAVLVLGTLGEMEVERATVDAFDVGFLLDRASASTGARLFLRSAAIRDPAAWLARNNEFGRRDFRFSYLGAIGQFGNQLFQLWHLILSALRHNARASTCAWEWNTYFKLSFLEREGHGPPLYGESSHWRIMGFWGLEELPDEIDFYAHFQWIPPFLACHRVFLTRCFTLRDEWQPAVAAILATLQSGGKPLAAFHVRRGDYLAGAAVNPMLRAIPTPWYRRALESLPGAVIYAASDDLAFIEAEFAGLAPLTHENLPQSRLPPALIDHCVLRAADVLLAINSSFSRSAAMLGEDGQQVLLPDLHRGQFEPYDPWNDPVFWLRFYDASYETFCQRQAEVVRWLAAAGVPAPTAPPVPPVPPVPPAGRLSLGAC